MTSCHHGNAYAIPGGTKRAGGREHLREFHIHRTHILSMPPHSSAKYWANIFSYILHCSFSAGYNLATIYSYMLNEICQGTGRYIDTLHHTHVGYTKHIDYQ